MNKHAGGRAPPPTAHRLPPRSTVKRIGYERPMAVLLKTMLWRSLRCTSLFSSPLLLRLTGTKARFSVESPKWEGLQHWRETPLNRNRQWGAQGPVIQLESKDNLEGSWHVSSLAEWGALILSTSDPLTKARLSHLAYSIWIGNDIPVGVTNPPERPARPSLPHLVSPKEIPAPKDSGLPLNAYMLHNLAHVELNAIDLAWDTVVRFSSFHETLGKGFFSDFAHVADDESRHFTWCSQRLAELGFNYGDMPAHNLLWRECEKTCGSVAGRLAVIPLVQEARGLDAGPRLVQRLVGFGDRRTSNIVAKIAEEEVAHVAVGVFWFLAVCQKMHRVPCTTFRELLKEFNVELKGPFNHPARELAGLPRDWYDESYANTEGNSKLSEVYERLSCIISLEKENSSLNGQ